MQSLLRGAAKFADPSRFFYQGSVFLLSSSIWLAAAVFLTEHYKHEPPEHCWSYRRHDSAFLRNRGVITNEERIVHNVQR